MHDLETIAYALADEISRLQRGLLVKVYATTFVRWPWEIRTYDNGEYQFNILFGFNQLQVNRLPMPPSTHKWAYDDPDMLDGVLRLINKYFTKQPDSRTPPHTAAS